MEKQFCVVRNALLKHMFSQAVTFFPVKKRIFPYYLCPCGLTITFWAKLRRAVQFSWWDTFLRGMLGRLNSKAELSHSLHGFCLPTSQNQRGPVFQKN